MNRESKPEKSNPKTGKFFVQSEKTMNSEPKSEKSNIETGKFFVRTEKTMNREPKSEKSNPQTGKLCFNQKVTFSGCLNFLVTLPDFWFEPLNFPVAGWSAC